MNWSVDWAWWGRDSRERQLSDRIQAFFESKGISRYGNQFTLNGNQLGAEHSAGLVAMNAVAGLAAANPAQNNSSRHYGIPPSQLGNGVTTTGCYICWGCCIAAVNFESGSPNRHKNRGDAFFACRNLYFSLILGRQGGILPEKRSFFKKKQKTLDLSLLKGYLVSKRLLSAL